MNRAHTVLPDCTFREKLLMVGGPLDGKHLVADKRDEIAAVIDSVKAGIVDFGNTKIATTVADAPCREYYRRITIDGKVIRAHESLSDSAVAKRVEALI